MIHKLSELLFKNSYIKEKNIMKVLNTFEKEREEYEEEKKNKIKEQEYRIKKVLEYTEKIDMSKRSLNNILNSDNFLVIDQYSGYEYEWVPQSIQENSSEEYMISEVTKLLEYKSKIKRFEIPLLCFLKEQKLYNKYENVGSHKRYCCFLFGERTEGVNWLYNKAYNIITKRKPKQYINSLEYKIEERKNDDNNNDMSKLYRLKLNKKKVIEKN